MTLINNKRTKPFWLASLVFFRLLDHHRLGAQTKRAFFMATSKLQKLVGRTLMAEFGFYDLRENHRPAWMTMENGNRLELDFYIPSLRFAVEIQGEQHYRFKAKFHSTYDDFLALQERDRLKKRLCEVNNVRLSEVNCEHDVVTLIEQIRPLLSDSHLARLTPTQPKTLSDWQQLKSEHSKPESLSSNESARQKQIRTANKKLNSAQLRYTWFLSVIAQQQTAITRGQQEQIVNLLHSIEKKRAALAALQSHGSNDGLLSVKRFLVEHNPPPHVMAELFPLVSVEI